jgi:hypothetical protein
VRRARVSAPAACSARQHVHVVRSPNRSGSLRRACSPSQPVAVAPASASYPLTFGTTHRTCEGGCGASGGGETGAGDGEAAGPVLGNAGASPSSSNRSPASSSSSTSPAVDPIPARSSSPTARAATCDDRTGTVARCVAHRAQERMVEPNACSLENRFGPLGPTRVQIPPPPLRTTNRMIMRFVGALCSPLRLRSSPALTTELGITGDQLANRCGGHHDRRNDVSRRG